jgi:hypothetical protein
LFKSRKFWTGVITTLVNALILYVPEFEAVRTELIASTTFIAWRIIDGYANEDRAMAEKTGQRAPKYEAVKDA